MAAGDHLNTVLLELEPHLVTHVMIEAAENIFAAINQRDLRPESGKDGGKFDRDITAPLHHDMTRQFGQMECLIRGNDVLQTRNILAKTRRRAGRNQNMFGADAFGVVGDSYRARVFEHSMALDDLDPVLRSHARHTHVLSGKHLLVLRAQGLFSRQALAQWPQLRDSCAIGGLLLRLLAALPQRTATSIVALRPSWRRRYLPTPPQ